MLRRHPAWRDVAFEVLKSYYVRETKTLKLRVTWLEHRGVSRAVVHGHPPDYQRHACVVR